MPPHLQITAPLGDDFTTTEAELSFTATLGDEENTLINLYPEFPGETWEGFACALTQSAGSVYAKMSRALQKELMRQAFSADGLAYRAVRIPLDSCDFCTEQYVADDDPADEAFARFDFSVTERYILPMLRDAEAAAGHALPLMLSPWSPPSYMKTIPTRGNGGSLSPEFYHRWADYLCRYIREFQARGFVVERMSLQNEPNATQTWDSCVYTAGQERDFLIVMADALRRNGLGQVELFIWDHNKERALERACSIIDQRTVPLVEGIACHWYSGDHFESLALLRQIHPALKLIISESCIEFLKNDKTAVPQNAARLSHEIIGDINHGITAFYDWNLLLDEQGGPNYVGNYCWAPFLYDTAQQQLIPQLSQKHFAHLAHAITPGSARIAVSRYTDQIDVAACQRPDGKLGIVLLNRDAVQHPVILRTGGLGAALELPPYAIASIIL